MAFSSTYAEKIGVISINKHSDRNGDTIRQTRQLLERRPQRGAILNLKESQLYTKKCCTLALPRAQNSMAPTLYIVRTLHSCTVVYVQEMDNDFPNILTHLTLR